MTCSTDTPARLTVTAELQSIWSLPDHASLQGRSDCEGFVDVISENSCYQTIVCGIGSLYDFMDAMETHNLLHWTKNLREHKKGLEKVKNVKKKKVYHQV